MSAFDEIDTRPSLAKRARFGLVLVVGAAVGASVAYSNGHPRAPLRLGVAAVVVASFALLPKVGRFAYIAWMSLGAALGKVTSFVVLLLVYAVFVVPFGVAFRYKGRDILKLKRPSSPTASYWEEYPSSKDVASYLRQS